MTLLDDVRTALRVSPVPTEDGSGKEPYSTGWEPTFTSDFDDEIQDLIDAALADLTRVGIIPSLLDPDSLHPLAKMAVKLYAKAHFGYDNDEATRLAESYERTVVDMMNSTANIACSRVSMRDCVIGDISDQTHTGHTVRPVPTVTYDGTALVEGTDFTVSYSDNVEVGTATAYIRGTGAYAGTVATTFDIVEE